MTLIKSNLETPSVRSVFSDLFDTERFFENDFLPKRFLAKVPAANVKEDDQKFEIELAAPGFSKDEIKINLEHNVLEISAEQKHEKKEEKKNYTRKEFNYNSFSRSFQLPEGINTDSINADYKEGILKLILPKKEVAKASNKKEIKLT
jgi:HSP20 family protein